MRVRLYYYAIEADNLPGHVGAWPGPDLTIAPLA